MAEKNVPGARAYADANEFDRRPQRPPMGVGVAQSDFGEMLPSLRLPIIGRAGRVQFDAENVVAWHGARHGITAVDVGRAKILPEEHYASHSYSRSVVALSRHRRFGAGPRMVSKRAAIALMSKFSSA